PTSIYFFSFLFFSFLDYLLECVNGIGRDYRGTKSRTNSGKICQRWDSSYPHRPKYVFAFDFTSSFHILLCLCEIRS
uniref:Kringle domain-containing protein n=1 Tax=Maylandia zebra TaxID=106582 RepID=A0A3P9BDZ7_9CICH